MRDILFRGKSVIDGNWVYGYLSYSDQENKYYVGVMELMTPVIPESVDQWTGLLDKNGTKVFEGDIVGVIKSWRKSDFECPECGNFGEVFTSANEPYYCDGDELECKECGLKGGVQCDEGGATYLWDW